MSLLILLLNVKRFIRAFCQYLSFTALPMMVLKSSPAVSFHAFTSGCFLRFLATADDANLFLSTGPGSRDQKRLSITALIAAASLSGVFCLGTLMSTTSDELALVCGIVVDFSGLDFFSSYARIFSLNIFIC